MVDQPGQSKMNKHFDFIGEILPNNERSNAILAQRREEEQRRKEEAERVSRPTMTSIISHLTPLAYYPLL